MDTTLILNSSVCLVDCREQPAFRISFAEKAKASASALQDSCQPFGHRHLLEIRVL